MPQKSEFKVYPDRLGAAGEMLSSCKTKAQSLAQQLSDVQRNITGSASSIGMIAKSVEVLQENLTSQAKRMEQAAALAKFSAARYSNAQRQLLGQPLLKEGQLPQAGGKGSAGTNSAGDVGKGTGKAAGDAGKGARKAAGGSAGIGAAAAAAAAAGTWKYGYEKHTTSTGPLKWKDVKDSYWLAYVKRQKGADGKEEESVSTYYGKTSTSQSISFLEPTGIGSYRMKDAAGRLDRFATGVAGLEKKIGDKLTINRFAKHDPLNSANDLRNDWSDRVWEGKRVPKNPAKPNGSKKLEMERHLTDADKKKNAFSKEIVGAKIVQWNKEKTVTAFGLSAEKKGKHTEGSASLSLLTASAGASAGAGVYYVVKNGRKVLAVGADAHAGASASVLKGDASGKAGYAPDVMKDVLGKDFQIAGVEGGASGKVGHVEAEGGAKARVVDGKLELAAEGGAGAYAAKGSVSGKAGLLGVKVGATAEANVGIGVSGKIGITGGKLRCEFGASLGIGFKLKFELDVQGAVDAVKNGIQKAAGAVAAAAKAVGNAFKTAGKAIANFFSGW